MLDNINQHFWYYKFSRSRERIFCQTRYKHDIAYFKIILIFVNFLIIIEIIAKFLICAFVRALVPKELMCERINDLKQIELIIDYYCKIREATGFIHRKFYFIHYLFIYIF